MLRPQQDFTKDVQVHSHSHIPTRMLHAYESNSNFSWWKCTTKNIIYLLIWWHVRSGTWGPGHARWALHQWATPSGPMLSANSKEQMVPASLMKMYPLYSRPPWNCFWGYDIVAYAKKSLPSFGKVTVFIWFMVLQWRQNFIYFGNHPISYKSKSRICFQKTPWKLCVCMCCVPMCPCVKLYMYVQMNEHIITCRNQRSANLCVLPEVLSWSSLIKGGSSKPREPLVPASWALGLCLRPHGNWTQVSKLTWQQVFQLNPLPSPSEAYF